MVFHAVNIDTPSPRVLGKLRKGKTVRIMSGEGFSLIVGNERYNPISKSFGKGKAYTITLTPAEIEANMRPPEEVGMEGQGIFGSAGKAIKKGFSKAPKALRPVNKALLPVGKAIAKEGVKMVAEYAPEVGATLGSSALSALALASGNPELVPVAEQVGSRLGKAGGKAVGEAVSKEANKRIDKYDPYGEQRINQPPSRGVASNILSSPVGTANLAQYLHSLSSEDIEMELAKRRGGGYSTPFDESGGRQVLAQYTEPVGRGLYASQGRGFRSNVKTLKEISSVGVHGNILGNGLQPPALRSQPYSSNFQMASRLPPAYGPLIKQGGGLYA